MQVLDTVTNTLTYEKTFEHHCGILFTDIRNNDIAEDFQKSNFLHGASLNTCLGKSGS